MTPFSSKSMRAPQSRPVANESAEAELPPDLFDCRRSTTCSVKFYVDACTDIGHFVNEKVQYPLHQDNRITIVTFQSVHGLDFRRPLAPRFRSRHLRAALAPDAPEQASAGDDGRTD